jgi:hypothetical protein
LRKKKSE